MEEMIGQLYPLMPSGVTSTASSTQTMYHHLMTQQAMMSIPSPPVQSPAQPESVSNNPLLLLEE
jgi:hypothetical protein